MIENTTYVIPPQSLLYEFHEATFENRCAVRIALDISDWLEDGMVALSGGFFKDYVTSIDYDSNTYSFGLSKQAHEGAIIHTQSPSKPSTEDDSTDTQASFSW